MKILKQLDLNDVVFFDIETTALVPELKPDTDLYSSWEYRIKHNRESDPRDAGKDLAQLYIERAALYPEFGRVVCVTIGKIKDEKVMLKSYFDYNEHKLLTEVANVFNNLQGSNKKIMLAGHAIKGFDVPYLFRRMLINGIELPNLLDVSHLKPWEINMIDTNELWRGTSFNAASLINIATAFGLPSPKDDMQGNEVTGVFYKEGVEGLKRIVRYCEMDVLTVANVVRKMRLECALEAYEMQQSAKPVGKLERTYNTKKLDKQDEKGIVANLEGLTEPQKKMAKIILDVATKDIV